MSRALLIALFLSSSPVLAETLPPVAQVVSNLVARAEQTAGKTNFVYTYTRTSRSARVDQAEPAETNVYAVTVRGKEIISAKISENGQAVPPEQIKPGRRSSDSRRALALTGELVQKYDFKLAGTDTIQDRPCFHLRFQPKSALEDASIQDKIFNRLGGDIWVDQITSEVCQLKVHLVRGASIWGGLAGTLSLFDLAITRVPIHPDLWVNKSVAFEIKGRRLLSGFHLQTREEYDAFNWEGSSPFVP